MGTRNALVLKLAVVYDQEKERLGRCRHGMI